MMMHANYKFSATTDSLIEAGGGLTLALLYSSIKTMMNILRMQYNYHP